MKMHTFLYSCIDTRNGRGEGENPRGGAKKRANRLIQKFNKSAYIVIEIFVVHYDVFFISFHFKKSFL